MTTYTQKLLFLYLVYVFANIVWPIELGLTYYFMGFGSSLFVWACTWRAKTSGLRLLSVAQEIEGSNPFARPIKRTIHSLDAPVAQRIEYWASNPGVAGSNPARRAINRI